MKTQNLFSALGVCVLATAASVSTTYFLNKKNFSKEEIQLSAPTFFTKSGETSVAINTDFTVAAERSVHSVVHVKTKFKTETHYQRDPFFEFFFDRPMQEPRSREQMATGSGVIISADGYIVTNNHVVSKADEVEVTLNDKRTFKAKIVGVDASTDIALLKIEGNDFPTIPLGNSDNLKVGEWVLAVGNPFNLTSTVTAGIVSAKARSINILTADMKIESFIQTDAAVNPGNSGGALVNTQGELVGINTAIASQTGSYAGYSFAVPTSIVGKVVADLKEFGVVQRAVLGIEIHDISDEFAKEKKIKTLNGVYIAKVGDGSAAQTAGLKAGDIITSVNDVPVGSVARLQEQIGRYRPGDKVKVEIVRGSARQEFVVELKNRAGSTGVVKAVDLSRLGAKFEPISAELKRKFALDGGLQVTKIEKNGAFAKNAIQKDYIILKVNNQYIRTAEDLEQILSKVQNSEANERVLFLSGVYPNGRISHYAVDLTQD